MNPPSLKELITKSYDAAQAEAALAFRPDDAAKKKLLEAGNAVLTLFPRHPGACALTTAMWAAFIRDNTPYPVNAVAGSLFIDDQRIFGSDAAADEIKRAFTRTNLDWDGHCWVQFGHLIGDVSVCRTAYTVGAPRLLTERVLAAFGKGRGLIAATREDFESTGIRYEPRYVLTNEEITSLFHGARSVIQSTSPGGPGNN